MGEEVGRTTAWYYCLTHHAVEPEGECKATTKLGPYSSADEAAGALEALHDREEQLSAADRAWTEEGKRTP